MNDHTLQGALDTKCCSKCNSVVGEAERLIFRGYVSPSNDLGYFRLCRNCYIRQEGLISRKKITSLLKHLNEDD